MRDKKNLVIGGLVLVVLLFGCALMARNGDTPGPASQVQPTGEPPLAGGSFATPTIDTPAPVGAPGIGDDVPVGSTMWGVMGMTDLGSTMPSDNEFIEPATTLGKFIRVDLAAMNQGSEPVSMITGPKLLDGQGRTFEPSLDLFMQLAPELNCVIERLQPGVPMVCAFVYETPADASGFRLEVTDLAAVFGGNRREIDLGK